MSIDTFCHCEAQSAEAISRLISLFLGLLRGACPERCEILCGVYPDEPKL